MLIPAILRKSEIQEKMRECFYTNDMMYETGYLHNWVPDISDNPDESTFQYAIINSNKDLIGFLSYRIDWYSSQAYNFGLFSFDRGNITIGKDLFTEMEKLINEYKLHRIEYRMVGGNPVERSYDKYCNKYKGTKHILKDVIRDKTGNYRDSIIYEIINSHT